MDLKEFLKQKEGWKYKPYEDIGGKLTVGAGNTTDIDPDKTYTDPELNQRLDSDIAVAKEDYSKLVSTETDSKLNENQKNMVQSLLMNVGGTQFKNSQALKELNAGNFDNYLKEASEFRKVKDKIIPGLVNRRKEEAEIFKTAPNEIVEDGKIINASFIDDTKINKSEALEIEAMNKSLVSSNVLKKKTVKDEIEAMNKNLVPVQEDNKIRIPPHIKKSNSLIDPIKQFWDDVITTTLGDDKETPSIMQMLSNGLGKSNLNVINRFHDDVLFTSVNPLEETRKKEDIGAVERWLEGITTIGVDLPVYLVGAFLGGKATKSAFGAGFGAGYLNDSIKTTYMKALEKGDVDTFEEWWDIFLKEGHKAGFQSGLTFGVTAAAPGAIGAKGIVQTQATILASLLSMHTLFKGELPNKNELIDTTALVATFAGIQAAPKVTQLYKKALKENKSAVKVIEETITNEAKLEEFASKNVDISKDKAIKTVEIEKINEKTGEITQETVNAKTLKETKPVIEEIKTKTEEAKPVIEEAKPVIEKTKPVIEEPVIPEVVTRPQETTNILENIQEAGKDGPAKRTLSKIGQDLITSFSDGLHPLFVARKKFFKNGGTFEGIDPYQLSRNYAGLESRILRFVEDSTLNGKTLNPNGKSLMDTVDPIINNIVTRGNFTAYAVSKRAIEKIDQGKVLSRTEEIIDPVTGEVTFGTKGITYKDAKVTVEKYENTVIEGTNKTYGEVFRELVDYQKRLVEYMVDSGVLDQKQADAMFAANRDMVPFYRVLEDEISGGQSRPVGNPFKTFKGSDKIIKDPIESIFKNTWSIITATEKNRVHSSFIDMVKTNPEIFPEITKSTQLKVTKINRETLEKIVDDPIHLTKNAEDGFTIFTRRSDDKVKIGQIEFLKDGKREVWNVGKDIAEALNTLNRTEANTFVKIMSTPSKLLRAGSVLNPDFVIASIQRDTGGAAVHSKNLFIPFYHTAVGLSHVLKKTPVFKEFVSSGGFQSMITSLDKNYFNKDMMKFTKQHKFRNQVRNPVELLRVFSETYEASTRMGDYILTRKRLKKQNPKMSEKDIIELTGYETRDLMDFAKIGNSVRNANRIYAFLNAQIRGGEKFIDTVRKRPLQFTAKTIAWVQLPSIALWLKNHDDPRYKELRQMDKDLNWIIITGDGTVDEKDKYTVYRIRKQHDVGLLIGTGTEKMLDYLYANENTVDVEKSLNEILGTFGNMYSFGYLPDAIRPIAENWANKSLYTENPIYSSRGEQIVPMLEYGPYTSETSKLIGEGLNSLGLSKISSPAQIDNIIKSYTGSLGRMALLGTDYVLKEAGIVDKIEMPDWELGDYPIVKSFILSHPKGRSSFISNFFDRYEKDLPKINSYYKLVEEGQQDRANELFKDDLEKQLILPTGELLIDMFGLVKFQVENKTATGEEKRKSINALYDRMIMIAERGLKTYEKLDKRKEEREDDD
tara:strand:- start:41 stop:4399 length:4359 start_codon:yes stop_codon:yes gene_type:complete